MKLYLNILLTYQNLLFFIYWYNLLPVKVKKLRKFHINSINF